MWFWLLTASSRAQPPTLGLPLSLGCGSTLLLRSKLLCGTPWKIPLFLNFYSIPSKEQCTWEVKQTGCLKCLLVSLKFDSLAQNWIWSEPFLCSIWRHLLSWLLLLGLRLLMSFLFLSLCGCPVFPILEAFRIFSLCLVLEAGSDGSWVALTRCPFRNTVIALLLEMLLWSSAFSPWEMLQLEENVQDQTVSKQLTTRPRGKVKVQLSHLNWQQFCTNPSQL